MLLLLLAGGIAYLGIRYLPTRPSGTTTLSTDCARWASSTPGPSANGNQTIGNWTTYHKDNSRSGYLPMGHVTSVRSAWAAPTRVDGQVYAEPLICGHSLFVATENDSVYAINVTTGGALWRTHLGTPVAGSSLPCGNIDPSGITGTPVIDVAARTIYVVAFLSPGQHILFGLNISAGSVRSQIVVDPPGADPRVEQERGALALSNGVVYIPYGGLAGDCGQYHGFVVGARTDGSATLLVYEVPTSREAGIWTPAGVTVAPGGDLFVATGNSASTTSFDYGESVIHLSPTLTVLDYFAPASWAQLNAGDTDLGSVAPTIVPNGKVFQIGKDGIGYLLGESNLGGIGGQLYALNLCSGAYGGTARVGQVLLIPCTDGIVNVGVGTSNLTASWKTSNFDTGSPIVTGDIVWATNTSTADLLGFNLTTGQEVFSFPLGSVVHFCTPAAAPGSLVVAGGDQVYSFALA